MKFWKFSVKSLATLLAAVSVTTASGPSDGEAAADPNSAVVKLTTSEYQSFMESNPLVLAEFFAPWCGYCKMLGPEYSKAADQLNESNPDIKLVQIDCTEEDQLCAQQGIRGYPTLKVIRGEHSEDYQGPRDADGMAQYMIRETLPPVQVVSTVEDLNTIIESQSKPFVIKINPSDELDATFEEVASHKKNDYAFISVSDKELIDELKEKFTNVDVTGSKSQYFLVHPSLYDDVREYSGDVDADSLTSFIDNESLPYFGDINRDTYMSYMNSPLPLAYYFYNNKEERDDVEEVISKLGKKHRGKLNFVGLDASMFGRHAEILNMNPEVVPFFAIHDVKVNKKYGVSQEEYPEGPSVVEIEKLVDSYLEGTAEAIIKSEPLPTEEEKASLPVVKLVAHNYKDIIGDLSKDIFVKYYAPWCGHCKNLAPTWEELAVIYGSNKDDANVIVANVDHTANDVETPYEITGYPTIIFYPANGKLDEETGIREGILFDQSRKLETFIDFVKENGYHGVDGNALKEAQEAASKEEVKEEEENVHDEL